MEGPVKKSKIDAGQLVRVVVQLIGDGGDLQTYHEGQLGPGLVEELREYVQMGPGQRQDIANSDPDCVLHKVFRYEREEEEGRLLERGPEETRFKRIKVDNVLDSPCYFVVMADWN